MSVMPEPDRRRQFETALSGEIYRIAWSYACRLCTVGGVTRCGDAEDLLQDALLRAYQCFHQLRDESRFTGWLLSIMRTCHLARLRRKGQSAVELDEEMARAFQQTDNPLVEVVLAALTQLPRAQQEILSLFYLDGLNLDETGQALGVTPRIVRQRLFRARAALRRRTAPMWKRQSSGIPTPQAKEGLRP